MLVDNVEIMDLYGKKGDQEFNISAGRHCITVQFREFNNDAFVIFDYSKIGE